VRGECIKAMNFEIFDRWGNRVFETNDPKIGWNGMHDGMAMNTGSYVYHLTATLFNSSTVTKKGNVTLVR
jgi:gliding motility-associated-like protein